MAESPESKVESRESRVESREPETSEEGEGKLEMERVVRQQDHAAIRLIAARPDLFGRQGAVVATWRRGPQPGKLVGCVKRTTNCRNGCVSGSRVPHRPHPNRLPKGEGTQVYGPYYCLSYREEGRQRSVYSGPRWRAGRGSPPEVGRLAAALAAAAGAGTALPPGPRRVDGA